MSVGVEELCASLPETECIDVDLDENYRLPLDDMLVMARQTLNHTMASQNATMAKSAVAPPASP